MPFQGCCLLRRFENPNSTGLAGVRGTVDCSLDSPKRPSEKDQKSDIEEKERRAVFESA